MKILYLFFSLLFICQLQAQTLDICVNALSDTPILDVDFDLTVLPDGTTYEFNDNDCYTLTHPATSTLSLVPQRENWNISDGITTFDLVLIQQHILGFNTFDNPYQMIAADGNGSGTITVFDLLELRKLILHINTELPVPGMALWRFFDASFEFDPLNPFAVIPPESIFLTAPFPPSVEFIGVKIGDVSGNGLLTSTETRSINKTLQFTTNDQLFKKGDLITVDFQAKDFENILGYQFTLDYDKDVLDYQHLQKGALEIDNNNLVAFEDEGKLAMSWNDIATTNNDDEVLFSLQFEAKENGMLSDFLQLNSSKIKSEAYEQGKVIELLDVALTFDTLEYNVLGIQNFPNPFKESTIVSFTLAEEDHISLDFYTLEGKLVKSIQQHLLEGTHQIAIDKNDLSYTGTLIYKLTINQSSITKKMIVLD